MKGKTKMANWKAKIWEHLTNYKKDDLHIPENGTRGDREYGHILPRQDGSENYVGDVPRSVSKSIKKHPDWYYLSSSQSMCINFFAPMVKNKDHTLLQRFLSLFDIKTEIEDAKFEYTPHPKESNFDFYCKAKDGSQFFFEIKYTEETINKKSEAKNLADTFDRRYRHLVENNPAFAGCNQELFMTKHFQAYRNMVMANDKDYSVFITMEGNKGTKKELEKSISDLKFEDGKPSHLLLLYWEEIVPKWIASLSEKGGKGETVSPEIEKYYRDFQRKYLLEQ